MKFSSIFYSITFMFIFSLFCISSAFIWLMEYDKNNYTRELNTKYSIVAQSTLMKLNGFITQNEYEEQIKDFQMPEIFSSKEEIIKNANILQEIEKTIGTATILEYKNKHYLKLTHDEKEYLLHNDTYEPYRYLVIKIVYWLIFSVFMITYVFVIRKIKPLRKLKRQINKFAKGDLDIVNASVGKDEISEVSEAFYEAVLQIKRLGKSRQLFLRNIMHELKTPITKGRITAEMLEDNKYKDRLINVFERLEILINEFAAIEKISSGSSQINEIKCNVQDIIDEAVDMGMVEKNLIDFNIVDISVQADFKLLSIAFKNLIDNALKYSNKLLVNVKEEKIIEFNSPGKPLEKDLEYYTRPFTQGKNAKSSFGLGLYLVNSIIEAHEYKFYYVHEDGYNKFIIDLKKATK